MTDDLVEELRKTRWAICMDAAAEIERLQGQVHHLDKIKDIADRYMDENETLRAENYRLTCLVTERRSAVMPGHGHNQYPPPSWPLENQRD